MIGNSLWRLSAVLLGCGGLAIALPASGQLDWGIGVLAYTIQFNGQTLGRVVVVSVDHPNPPSGYTPGYEYWTWTAGTPWRGAFKLVPTSNVPSYSSYTWETFPHDHFDLSQTVPLPSINPAPDDKFYQVAIQNGSTWTNQGYMWLEDGSPSAQTWYGIGLTDDLVGNGGEIRFQSVEPPSAGSVNVYLLE
jgi:hypothetical protein